jgi:pyruvate dehydrogenase E2 component (dihydrolipoamide acetyltransferase)
VVDGQVVPRKIMNLSITFDHRVIDGAQGARFMRDLVQLLEHPELLMARL